MPSGEPKALVPRDVRGVRQQQIGYLQNPNSFIEMLLRQGGGGGNIGTLGVPQSGLQMQGADALGAMLRQPTPEQRALDISLPQLQEMLTGQGPQFERDLSLANQQGGRFGSANAILRGEALRNQFNMRNQTAGTLGMLSGSAGQANRGLAGQAFNTGQQQAFQGDIETQRRLQILMQLLGVGQQTAFNVPIQAGSGPLDFLSQIAGIASSFIPGSPGVTGQQGSSGGGGAGVQTTGYPQQYGGYG